MRVVWRAELCDAVAEGVGLRARRRRAPPSSVGAAFAFAWWIAVSAASAHPMGYFAISHYARLHAEADILRVRYVLDLAEIAAVPEKRRLDSDGDGRASPEEQHAYLAANVPALLQGLTLLINDARVPLHPVRSEVGLSPGEGQLDTMRISVDLDAAVPAMEGGYSVLFRDETYDRRTGWREMIVVAGRDVVISNSSARSPDRSRELSAYPPDVTPPQDTEASFTVLPAARAAVP